MALRDIVKDGNSVLRKKSREVEVFDEKLGKLLDDMHETMIAADGCGLAAPQVGLLKRVAVVEVDGDYFEFVNPVIISQSGSQQGPEGCLSVPGRSEEVIRPYKITVISRTERAINSRARSRTFSHALAVTNSIISTEYCITTRR